MNELNKYYVIDERRVAGHKYQLHEHKFYGDEVPCILTKDGIVVSTTFDDIYTAVDEYLADLE